MPGTSVPSPENVAIVERYRQAAAAQERGLIEDAGRLHTHVLRQFAALTEPPTFEAEASVAGSLMELGNLAQLAGRRTEAIRYFRDSAAAYEDLASRSDPQLDERARKARARTAQDRAITARSAAQKLSHLDPENLPPA